MFFCAREAQKVARAAASAMSFAIPLLGAMDSNGPDMSLPGKSRTSLKSMSLRADKKGSMHFLRSFIMET